MFHSKGAFTKTLVTLGLACGLSLHPSRLVAGPITWTIASGAQMTGGASVAGSFQYDADTNTYSNVDITVGDDANPLFGANTVPVPGDTYYTTNVVLDPSFPDTTNNYELVLSDSTNDTGLELFFQSQGPGLTDNGGSEKMGIHVLEGGQLADYESPGYTGYNAQISAPTPEPQTWMMMFSGILGTVCVKAWSSSRSNRQLATVKASRN